MARSAVILFLLALAFKRAAAATNNTVTDWQYVAQQVARDEKLPHQIAVRVYALVALATHGALVVNEQKGYDAPEKEVAAFAGHYVLSELYPGQQSKFDVALQKQLGTPYNVKRSRAYKIAKAVAAKLLRDRANDGSQLFVNFVPSPPGGPVGKYQFTPNQTFALYPQLAKTRPFTSPSPSAFTGKFKKFDVPSPEYNKELAETQRLGRKDSTIRTQDQTDIATFWAGIAGTKTVAGYWSEIAFQLLKPSDAASLPVTARLLALFFTALYDNNIAVWHIKYSQLFWRPVTAINQGDGTSAADPTWTPFLATPPHPEYPSGHQATSGAAYGILKRYLGANDAISVTVVTDDPAPGSAALPPRTYTSLKAVTAEVGDSRIYGGLHLRKSNIDPVTLGDAVAGYAVEHFNRKWGRASRFV